MASALPSNSRNVIEQELKSAEEFDLKAEHYRSMGDEAEALEYERCAKLARIQAERARLDEANG